MTGTRIPRSRPDFQQYTHVVNTPGTVFLNLLSPLYKPHRACRAGVARIIMVLHALPQSGHETCHRVTVIYRSVTRDEGTDALGKWEGSR